MPHWLLDACNELTAPIPPSSFDWGGGTNHYWGSLSGMRRGICLAAVFVPGCGARASHSCLWRGIPCGNAGGLVSGTLARSGQAVSSSPGLHPSADAGVWWLVGTPVIAITLYWCYVGFFLRAGLAGGATCCALAVAARLPWWRRVPCQKGWQSNKRVPEINKICINELQWLWMPN